MIASAVSLQALRIVLQHHMMLDVGWKASPIEDLQQTLTTDLFNHHVEQWEDQAHFSNQSVSDSDLERFKIKFYKTHTLGFIDEDYIARLQNMLQRIVTNIGNNAFVREAQVR